jgi:8-oxo-dGTP diphosphatase
MDVRIWVATKAFLLYKDKVLILREADKYKDGTNSGKYDVVGGRVEPGQKFDESLLREIKEETGLVAKIGKPFYVGEWRPVVRGERWQIVATFFECTARSNRVSLSEDHDDYLWINPEDFRKYKLIDNLIPAFKAYISNKK